MDNPGSSIISALGAGSGVDFVQLANDLSEATYAAQRTNLESRNETLTAQISAASLLRSSLSDLASALGDRIRTGDLAPQVTIGNGTVADVSMLSGTNPTGSYSLEVSQLAQSQLLASQAYSAPTDAVGEGTLRIRFGSTTGGAFTEDSSQAALAISVETTDTLETLAAKITSESDGTLNAYVANGASGARLVVKGADGENSGFVLEGESSATSPTATPGDLSYLSWSPATDAGELRQSAQDALFEFDTVAYRSASNTVSDLPENLTLELTGTNAGSPTTIGFTSDTASITAVMTDFVAALNDIAGLINESGNAQGGELGNDAGVRDLKRDLGRLTSEVVMPNAEVGAPNTLGDLGLSINRDGTFSLDSDRLNESLTSSPEGVAAMFTTGVFGVFATMDSFARDNTLTSDPGSLGGSVARYEGQIERNDERLERIAQQQDNLRERLTDSLVAAERIVSSSQSTLTFLQNQIDIWNNQN
ncbi:MAG: flagellar filament capping protein FliD [Pseudomonadota bacterium]